MPPGGRPTRATRNAAARDRGWVPLVDRTDFGPNRHDARPIYRYLG